MTYRNQTRLVRGARCTTEISPYKNGTYEWELQTSCNMSSPFGPIWAMVSHLCMMHLSSDNETQLTSQIRQLHLHIHTYVDNNLIFCNYLRKYVQCSAISNLVIVKRGSQIFKCLASSLKMSWCFFRFICLLLFTLTLSQNAFLMFKTFDYHHKANFSTIWKRFGLHFMTARGHSWCGS